MMHTPNKSSFFFFQILLVCVIPFGFLKGQELPELPQEWIETCVPETDKTITVCSAGCTFLNSQLQTYHLVQYCDLFGAVRPVLSKGLK